MSLSHRNLSQWVWTLTWPLQNLNLVFLEPFRGGLAGVFGIIVLLHNPSALELEDTNRRSDILLQGFMIECRIHGFINYGSNPGPEDHHTTTTVFDCWYMKCCIGFMPDLTGHTPSTKISFCLISPLNICQILGIIKIFFGKYETSLCVLFGQQCLLPCNSPMDAVFAQSLS